MAEGVVEIQEVLQNLDKSPWTDEFNTLHAKMIAKGASPIDMDRFWLTEYFAELVIAPSESTELKTKNHETVSITPLSQWKTLSETKIYKTSGRHTEISITTDNCDKESLLDMLSSSDKSEVEKLPEGSYTIKRAVVLQQIKNQSGDRELAELTKKTIKNQKPSWKNKLSRRYSVTGVPRKGFMFSNAYIHISPYLVKNENEMMGEVNKPEAVTLKIVEEAAGKLFNEMVRAVEKAPQENN